MNEDLYWEAQWVIGELERVRHMSESMTTQEHMALDVLLQLKL